MICFYYARTVCPDVVGVFVLHAVSPSCTISHVLSCCQKYGSAKMIYSTSMHRQNSRPIAHVWTYCNINPFTAEVISDLIDIGKSVGSF